LEEHARHGHLLQEPDPIVRVESFHHVQDLLLVQPFHDLLLVGCIHELEQFAGLRAITRSSPALHPGKQRHCTQQQQP
jgi:hypothetical protein